MIVLMFPVFVAAVVILTSSFLTYWLYLRRNHYWLGKSIPSHQPIPFFGSLFGALLGKSFFEFDAELYKKYGKVFGAYQGSKPYIYVADLEMIRSILAKDFHIFSTRSVFKYNNIILDSGLTQIEGDKWKRLRSMMTPAFSTAKVKNMIPLISDSIDCTLENLERFCCQNQTVNIRKLYLNFSLDAIANVAYGTKLDSYNDPDNEFVTHSRKIFDNLFNLKRLLAYLFPKIAKFFGISMFPEDSVDFFAQVVNSIVERRQKTKEVRHDFLQSMMDCLEVGDRNVEVHENKGSETIVQSVSHIKIKHLSKLEFQGQTVVFIMAGFETTSTTLTLASYYLAVNPHIQKRASKEVDEIWSKTDSLDAEALHAAKYIEAVIKETLRISPPGTRLERVASQDYVLGDTGVTIPKGMSVKIPVYSIHHDDQYFPDPEEFRPERFLNDEVQPYSYLPFGAGPRNCIASRLALTEIKLCLLHVLRRFELSPCIETQIPFQYITSGNLLQLKDVFLQVTERGN